MISKKKLIKHLKDSCYKTYQFSCSYDYFKIAVDYNLEVGKYCGEHTGKIVVVNGDYAVLTFHSDETDQERGFRVSLTMLQGGKCTR